MSYIVVYQRTDGSSGVEECGDMDLAIVTAERLRNVDAVERPRIFKTEEIRYDFRPYYRVEVMKEGDTEPEAPAASSTANAFALPDPPAPDAPATFETIEPPAPYETVAPVEAEHVEPAVSPFAVVDPEPAEVVAVVENDAVIEQDTDSETSVDSVNAAMGAAAASEQLAAPPLPAGISGGGLFGTEVAPETNEFADIVEDAPVEAKAESPRRGLFGR